MTPTQPLELLAPLAGVLLPLDQVPDPVFSSRLIGDGVCIDPTSQTLCAPLAGVISNIQDSGHAVSVTDDNGVQVLMHIGLDTVSLGGNGFTLLAAEGQTVDAGQPIIAWSPAQIEAQGLNPIVPVIALEGDDSMLKPPRSGQRVAAGGTLMTWA